MINCIHVVIILYAIFMIYSYRIHTLLNVETKPQISL